MNNYNTYRRITARLEGLTENFVVPDGCMDLKKLTHTEQTHALPEALREKVLLYVFSRRGQRRRIARELSYWFEMNGR